MTSKKPAKRKSQRPRRTAIVPRVVFQTLVAVAVVPAMGCGQATTPNQDSGFSVVAPNDASFGVADSGPGDTGMFSVAAPIDGGNDAGTFSVAVPNDAGDDGGFFSVAAPLDGAFSVIIAPPDASA